MEKNLAISGLHIGEHSFVPEKLTEEFEVRGVPDTSYLVIRTQGGQIAYEHFYEWAKWCTERKIYFMTLFGIQNPPEGKESQYTPEVISKMKEIAGEYYMGELLGEVGTNFGARPKGYGQLMKDGLTDLRDCRDYFLKEMKKYIDTGKKLGIPHIVAGEATALLFYTMESGIDIPILELLPGDPEFLVSVTRGCAYAYDTPTWGTYIAHEWYGGIRQDDFLKSQRLKIAYRYPYLSGSHIVCLESGDEMIDSMGYHYPVDHPICVQYREEMRKCEERFRNIPRIAPEPETKIAFIYGNLDAYTGYQGSNIWEQYDRDEWSMGPAEWSWRITEELRRGRSWQEVENYGDEDLSAAPAYGLYDVVPASISAEKLAKYETVIFAGWNSMTEELWNTLREYVKNGGHLFITAAHLNTNTKRDGKYMPIFDGKTAEFLGCDIVGTNRINVGIKYLRESLKEKVLYPVVRNGSADTILPAGVFTAALLDNITVDQTAVWTDCFSSPAVNKLALQVEPMHHYIDELGDNIQPAVIENAYGKGVVTFLATVDYPGHNSVYPFYRMLAREFVTASHRRCEIKVKSSDKLRFSVYKGEDKDMLCLLNTDFTNPINVTVEAYGKTYTYTVPPCELVIEYLEK